MEQLDARRLDYLFEHRKAKNPYQEVQRSLNDELKFRKIRMEGLVNHKRKTSNKIENAKIAKMLLSKGKIEKN